MHLHGTCQSAGAIEVVNAQYRQELCRNRDDRWDQSSKLIVGILLKFKCSV